MLFTMLFVNSQKILYISDLCVPCRPPAKTKESGLCIHTNCAAGVNARLVARQITAGTEKLASACHRIRQRESGKWNILKFFEIFKNVFK